MSRSYITDPEKMTHFGYLTIPEKEKAEWVRRHFNSVARKYDSMNTLLSLGIHYQWKRMAVRMMDLRSGDRVLDVCGGTGDLSRMAAERVAPSGRVVLYDINWEMMAAGRPKTSASPHSRPDLFRAGRCRKNSLPGQQLRCGNGWLRDKKSHSF